MNKKILTIGIIIILVAVVGATTLFFNYPYEPIKPPEVIDEGWTNEGVKSVVSANNMFAFDFYEEISKEEGNLFFSPYSVSVALAMTYDGARGQTADEIRNVFYFPEDEVLRPNSARIYNEINKVDKSYTLRTGNALWVEKTFELREDYQERVEKYYGGKAVNLDFINEPDLSRNTINSFIEEQTNNRIKDLIPEGTPDSLTRLILTNAIYFLGDWKYQFDEKNTNDLDFYVTPDDPVKVPMMHMKADEIKNMKPEPARFNYANLEDVQLLEMPYKDDELSMLVILPDNINEFNIDYSTLQEYKEQMQETRMDGIFFPKFEIETEYGLNNVLINLGMPTSFTRSADFSGMNEFEELYISGVIHKAFVKVDEEGTEAAAATAVVIRATSAIMEPKIFRADKPFLFLIQETSTGNILFMGRINDPTE